MIRFPALACAFLSMIPRILSNTASTLFFDGVMMIFPSLYRRTFCPRKSNPSSICVILVFSCESSSPRSFKNSSTRGLTSFSSNSFELPVIICQLDEELAAGFRTVLALIHWPEPGVHLSIHQALHSIVQHHAIAGDKFVCCANSVWIFRICVV